MDLPKHLTLEWLLDHADQHLFGPDSRWNLVTWNRVVFVKVSHPWSTEPIREYVAYTSGIRRVVRAEKERVFVVFDTTEMEPREADARQYLPPSWVRLLEEGNLAVCIVDERPARRDFWLELHTLVGKRYRVRIFASVNEALGWVRDELIVAGVRHG